MRKRHFIRLFLICIVSVIFSLSISQSSLAFEKEIKSLSSAISEDIVKAEKKTIAVTDFLDLQGNVNELGRFIAEEISVNLVDAAKGFQIIDRIHLKSILAEHKLSMSGLVDPNTVKKLGKITGAEAIVTGSVTPFRDSIRVSAKVIVTDTARVIGAARSNIAKTQAIEELLAREIETTADTLTPTTPRPTARVQQKAEVHNFLFELIEARLSGGNVRCELLVTNKAEDRKLEMYTDRARATKMFDDFGNQYIVDRAGVQIGSIRSRSLHSSVRAKLISGIPTRIILNFPGVSPEATSIALLEISCEDEDKRFIVQFRNIPLSR